MLRLNELFKFRSTCKQFQTVAKVPTFFNEEGANCRIE